MSDIVKLYILDEHENELGRLVLDIERLVKEYASKTGQTISSADQEDQVLPISMNDELVKIESENRAWYRTRDGRLYLTRKREP